VIFDYIEWDEANLDHATKRLTAAEIEQAIRNADGKDMNLSRDAPDRRLIRSTPMAASGWRSSSSLSATGRGQITGWAE
jgi:hypothetical protein